MKPNIPLDIKALADIFHNNGKSLYIVGGFNRDFLMGYEPKDIDLATDSLPDETISFLSDKYDIDLVGKSFGVVIIKNSSDKIEIASFRKDVTSGRKPEIELVSSINVDCQRRDITISAIYYDIIKEEFIDIVDGINDINSKIIKMVGEPDARISEDPLRILRVPRFMHRYNFALDNVTSKAISKNKGLINTLSRDRISQELVKAFEQAKNYSQYLEFFNEFDMWDQIFPGLKINTEIKDTKYIETYFANLFKFVDSSKLLFKLKNEYKLTEKIDPRQIVFLLDLLSLSYDNALELYKKKVVSNITVDMILEWYRINNISSSMFVKFLDYKPSVNTEELMQQGFLGKELGDMIKKLERESFISLVG